jgi:hypothetical protein
MAFVTVKGTINRVFYQGKGAEVVEKFNVKGRDVSKYWSAWFENPHGLSEGDQVEVSGLHGDELNEYEKDGETRRNVKRSINKATVKDHPAVPAQPDADTWGNPPADNDYPF